jgi:hypothetical protein
VIDKQSSSHSPSDRDRDAHHRDDNHQAGLHWRASNRKATTEPDTEPQHPPGPRTYFCTVCIRCGRSLRASIELLGRRLKCRCCHEVLTADDDVRAAVQTVMPE